MNISSFSMLCLCRIGCVCSSVGSDICGIVVGMVSCGRCSYISMLVIIINLVDSLYMVC